MITVQPNPQELDLMLTPDGVDAYKRYKCRLYEKCLTTAADASWNQFHCNDCLAYVPPPANDPTHALFARLGRLFKNGHNK